MATVIFYEKPGCATNARQKQRLKSSGHALIERDLLSIEWSEEALRPYFGDKPVEAWFNPAAPRVKSGEIKPAELSAAAALAAMVADPLLIKRPLIDVCGTKLSGFDAERLAALIGLEPIPGDGRPLDGCASPHRDAPCPAPAAKDGEGTAA